ncbi:MAG: nucleotide-binding universal stress UspA family protein [Saprospiraceae bacterium]|jgi:nucleotide-binding universal stress UspA family protein
MKILCPTDFSEHSTIALEYAMNLANALDAEIHILSVYQVNKTATSLVSMDDIIRENHEDEMKKLVSGLGTLVKKDRLPLTKIMKGSTVNAILKYAKHFEIDLIVMGTQGGNSLRTILLGSTTKKLAGKTPIPILAIPETVKHQLANNKIVLALDNKLLNNSGVFKVPEMIAKHLSQKIDILHIKNNEDKEDKEAIPFDPFTSEYLGDTMGEIIIEEGVDTIQSIKNYAESNNIGMLIMVRREKSFLQKLLIVGNTAAELAKTNIPLMIVPE